MQRKVEERDGAVPCVYNGIVSERERGEKERKRERWDSKGKLGSVGWGNRGRMKTDIKMRMVKRGMGKLGSKSHNSRLSILF